MVWADVVTDIENPSVDFIFFCAEISKTNLSGVRFFQIPLNYYLFFLSNDKFVKSNVRLRSLRD